MKDNLSKIRKEIQEGSIKFFLPLQTEKISKEQEVFYNPAMILNRDISVLICKIFNFKSVADVMCATGIRGLRIKKESNVEKVVLNDINPLAIELSKENMINNNISCNLSNLDSNLFLLNSTGFDYIDIDPFGSPNQFIQNAVIRISRGGVIAITATDTAPLSGTFPLSCERNYWSKPLRTEIMHEIGLRILIRKVQLIGTQFDKALIPILSYYKEHYFRIFFKIIKSKEECDKIIKNHSYLYFSDETGESIFENKISIKELDKLDSNYFNRKSGPLWSDKILDFKILDNMCNLSKDDDNILEETKKFLETLKNESQVSENIFINLHQFVKRNKFELKKTNDIIDAINKKGFLACKSHMEDIAIRTNMPYQEIINLFKTELK